MVKFALEAVTWHAGRVLSSAWLLQPPGLLGTNLPQKPACKRAAGARSAGGGVKRGTGSAESLSLALFFFLIHFSWVFSGMLTTSHTNPCHKSVRVILSVPADEKKHYSAIWSRSCRSFITQRGITGKLLTTFSLSVQGVYSYVMQIFYAFLCILFFYSSRSLLSFFPFAHLSFADHRGQTDWKHVCK